MILNTIQFMTIISRKHLIMMILNRIHFITIFGRKHFIIILKRIPFINIFGMKHFENQVFEMSSLYFNVHYRVLR